MSFHGGPLVDDDVGKFAVLLPGLQTALNEGLGLTQIAVWSPHQLAGNLRILGIGLGRGRRVRFGLDETGKIGLGSKPERRAENQRRGRRVDSQVGIFQLCGYPSNAIVATPKAISAAPAIRVFDLCSFNKKMPTSAPRTTLTSRVAPA